MKFLVAFSETPSGTNLGDDERSIGGTDLSEDEAAPLFHKLLEFCDLWRVDSRISGKGEFDIPTDCYEKASNPARFSTGL